MAQTNPTAYSLAAGNYSFTDWPSTSAAGSFPPSMAFRTFLERIEVFAGAVDQAPNGDWLLAYKLTSGPRINGDGSGGVSFLQTSSAQSGNCSFVGDAILALNSVGRADIGVTFTSQVTGAGTRPYVLRLQYRIGSVANWTDVITANGSKAEYNSSVVTTAQTISAKLPLVCENQSLVQVRWLYFQDGAGSGSRPRIRLDDIAVSSSAIAGTPTNLLVYTVSPISPSQNIPFTVVVRSTDAFGAPKNVASATTVTLSKVSGTGTLSGTLVGTILAGESTVTFGNVSYNVAEAGVVLNAAVTAGSALTGANSASMTTQSGATYAITDNAQTTGFVNVPFNPFTVTVYRSDNQIDVNYQTPITITKVSGTGSITGTATVTPFRGVAIFDNVMINTAGTYTLQLTIPGLTSQTLPLTTISAPPGLTTDIVPQYIQARTASGTCNSSVRAFPVPVYARVTFTGLQPNTTYRYNTGAAKDQILTSTGGGVNVHYSANDNTFKFASGKSLDTDGEYSTFSTTGTQTTKSLWVNLVATTNDAFQEGNIAYWRVALADNNGKLLSRYQLAQTSTVIRLGTGTTQATGIADRVSQLTPKNYVLLYDNTAGTGRPLAVAIVQGHGTVVGGAEGFYAVLENVTGAWATLVPNTNLNGVRRIEERNYTTNAIVYSITSADGIWNGVQTNPSDVVSYPSGPGGFSSPIYIETPRVSVSTPTISDSLCATTKNTINFIARGVTNVKIEYSTTSGLSWNLVDIAPAASGKYDWIVPAIEFSPNSFIRVTGVERTDISATSNRFVIVAPLALVNQIKSKNLCIGNTDTLIVFTSGSIRGYDWYKDGVKLLGVSGPVLILENVQYRSSGEYWCIVRGYANCGDLTTNKATIRVGLPTKIVAQTFAAPAVLGETARFYVEAEVPGNEVAYSWFKGQTQLVDNGRIFGASSNHLEIRNVKTSDVGNDYYCIVTGVCGSATSRVMRLFNSGVYAEFITANVSACINANVVVKADVYTNPGGEAIDVRWYRDGIALSDGGKYSGTTTNVLTIQGVNSPDAGQYEVRATMVSDNTQTASAFATVVIATTPAIASQPSSGSVCAGQGSTMGVTAVAQGNVTYQWFHDGVAVSGANAATYTIANTTASRAGSYYVVVSTACGSKNSDTVTLTVKPATVITQQPPKTLDVQIGQPLTINVVGTGSGTLQYQWSKDGTELAGEVAPTFSKITTVVADAGSYWCRVRSECGDVNSDTTTVTIRPVVSVDEDVVAGGATISRVTPNPVNTVSTVTVTLPRMAHVTMKLVNASGVIVLTVADVSSAADVLRFDIDSSNLASGMYMLVTTINGASSVQTLAIVK
ncbi:MAG: immunoglobulin domain-containing protein [Ignavibacteria bacterium]|nr:immunoglobulin domain-containing protein [Ignavibacteria bacterium]